jgi:hypothetical protein
MTTNHDGFFYYAHPHKKPGVVKLLHRVLNQVLRRALLLLMALLTSVALAADVSHFTYAEVVPTAEGYVLNADLTFELSPKLTSALDHGVALHFVTELRVERPRWYWFDKVVVDYRLDYRLAYHALTRSYRLTIGSLHHSFDNLTDALFAMRRVRNLNIASVRAFSAGISHEARLRFRHDTSQLPKPFQLSAVASDNWGIDTGWMEWFFLPGTAVSR